MSEESQPSPDRPSQRPPRERRRRSQPERAQSEYHHRNRAVLVPDGHMAVGRIVGSHALNGELRVELHTDFPERFAAGETIFLGTALSRRVIERARDHKGMILLTLAGLTERTEAEELREEWLFIPDSAALPLPEGEYYVHDIVGLAVLDEGGLAVGRVTDVLQTGANDVYIISPAPGINRDKELLIPAIAEVVQRVDLAVRTLTIRLIPGLLDE